MTIIVYHNGVLATDSKVGIHQNDSDLERMGFDEKAWTSEDGQLVMACAGRLPPPDVCKGLIRLTKQLIRIYKAGPAKFVAEWPVFYEHYNGNTYVVLTKDAAYLIGDEHRGIKLLDDTDIVTMGSGCWIAKAAVTAGQSAPEAVQTTIRLDSFCGGEIHVYHRSKLKALRNNWRSVKK